MIVKIYDVKLAHDVIGGHVGVLNNSEKSSGNFGSIIMQKESDILRLFLQTNMADQSLKCKLRIVTPEKR